MKIQWISRDNIFCSLRFTISGTSLHVYELRMWHLLTFLQSSPFLLKIHIYTPRHQKPKIFGPCGQRRDLWHQGNTSRRDKSLRRGRRSGMIWLATWRISKFNPNHKFWHGKFWWQILPCSRAPTCTNVCSRPVQSIFDVSHLHFDDVKENYTMIKFIW